MWSGFRLYLITDRRLCGGSEKLLEICGQVATAVTPGFLAFQLREQEIDDRELLWLGKRLKDICRESGCQLIINRRVDLAKCVEADGVHLNRKCMPIKKVRKIFSGLIGFSTHNSAECRSAEKADFITLSPVFNPLSKESAGPALGIENFNLLIDQCNLPTFALGGVTVEKIEWFNHNNIAGVALISDILTAPNPVSRIVEYQEKIGKHK